MSDKKFDSSPLILSSTEEERKGEGKVESVVFRYLPVVVGGSGMVLKPEPRNLNPRLRRSPRIGTLASRKRTFWQLDERSSVDLID
jgi:hypothetical protein